MSLDRAGEILGLSREELPVLTRRRLVRLYRRKARRHHPDKGGASEKFIALTEAYQCLLQRLGER